MLQYKAQSLDNNNKNNNNYNNNKNNDKNDNIIYVIYCIIIIILWWTKVNDHDFTIILIVDSEEESKRFIRMIHFLNNMMAEWGLSGRVNFTSIRGLANHLIWYSEFDRLSESEFLCQ